MKTYYFLVAFLLVFMGMAAAQPTPITDEYSKYMGQNVTVNACNLTAYQGVMIEWWPNSIVIKEMCNPELGNITIKKSCIIWIHTGYICL